MSTVGSPRPFAHRHFGFDNPHALGAGRLSPLLYDSLVAISCSLINFSSRASSRWVHMDLTWGPHLESFPLYRTSLLPGRALGLSGPVSGWYPGPIKAPINRTMVSGHGLRPHLAPWAGLGLSLASVPGLLRLLFRVAAALWRLGCGLAPLEATNTNTNHTRNQQQKSAAAP